MKCFALFALIVVVGLSVVSGRNATFGARKNGDVELDFRNVFKPAQLGLVRKAELRYGYIRGNRNVISLIKVIDHSKKGSGDVFLQSGGPRSTNFTLKFESKRGKGISCQVLIYGRNATRIN